MRRPPRPRVFDVPLSVRRHPDVPEIALHLLSEDVDLSRHVREILDLDLVPFWPFVWAGGASLARYVLDHPDSVAGRTVVDFGAGSGIVGIACALSGAREVVCVDVDDHARAACEANADLNRVTVTVSASVPPSWDLLLAADVLYASDNTSVLSTIAVPDRRLILCEAERPGAPRPSKPPLARFSSTTFPDVDLGAMTSGLYAFDGREAWDEAFGLAPAAHAGSRVS